MTILLNALAFVLGDLFILVGGYTLHLRHRIKGRKTRQREFLARGEA